MQPSRRSSTRYFTRRREEGKPLPDLVVIDGGKGQLTAALEAAGNLGVEGPAFISLAKREERCFFPGRRRACALRDGAPLSACSSGFVMKPTGSASPTAGTGGGRAPSRRSCSTFPASVPPGDPPAGALRQPGGCQVGDRAGSWPPCPGSPPGWRSGSSPTLKEELRGRRPVAYFPPMSRAFVKEDSEEVPERYELPPRSDPGYPAAAAWVLLEGANRGDNLGAGPGSASAGATRALPRSGKPTSSGILPRAQRRPDGDARGALPPRLIPPTFPAHGLVSRMFPLRRPGGPEGLLDRQPLRPSTLAGPLSRSAVDRVLARAEVRRRQEMWRYRPFLPLMDDEQAVSSGRG